MKQTKKYLIYSLICILSLASFYGLGRLYYRLTDGFTEGNIHYDVPLDLQRSTASLDEENKKIVENILAQEFFYLGKGCQSYVFASRDGQHVIKFFKYQRFCPPFWLGHLAFMPFIDQYYGAKVEKKRKKLDNALASWQMAYEELPKETGVVYAHLDKSFIWPNKVILYDKMGFQHALDINSLEFMIQKKAAMLCSQLKIYQLKGDLAAAKMLIDNLLSLLLSEYARGYADNDHALMQNTGVFEARPIHIDVGQFVKNPLAAKPEIYQQELFNKMWKFRLWLHEEYPELAEYTTQCLKEIIGSSFNTLTPQLNKSSMGRIPPVSK